MKKLTRYLIPSVLIALLAPTHAAVNLFRNSLPSQAGVGSVFIFDTWDYLVTPAFYSKQTDNAVSMVYTPDQYDAKTFVMGGRHTIGFPLYWAVALKNERQKNVNYDPTAQKSYEATEKPMHFRATLGTHFNGFGVGIYGEYLDNSTVWKNTANGTTYLADAKRKDATSNVMRAGINLGQNTPANLVWSVGLGVRQLGGRFYSDNGAGTVQEGISNLNLTGGNLASPTQKTEAELSTFGWLNLSDRGDRAYWRGNLRRTLDAGVTVKRNTSKATIGETRTLADLFAGYAMAWPLSDNAKFYFGPEFGVLYNSLKTTAANGATGSNFSGGATTLGLSVADQKLAQGDASLAIQLNLPIVFQLPVVKDILMLQAGWYPELTLYQLVNKEQTDTQVSGKVVDNRSNRFLQSNAERYGAGLTYTPVARLRLHMLFTTGANSSNVVSEDRIDISRVSLGVDYVFAVE